MRTNLGQNEDNKNAKNSIKAANSNMCVEAENDRRSRALRSKPRARRPFPLTTVVRITEDKKQSHDPALQVISCGSK